MLARAILLQPRLLVIDGLLDPLPDSLLLPAVKAVFDALPQATVLLITGRRELAQCCSRAVSLGDLPSAHAAGSHNSHPELVNGSPICPNCS